MSIIGLITDLGEKDYFVPSMKGVILSINPNAKIVDITHQIPKHEIRKAAFVLAYSVETFPKNSTFIAEINPEVGTEQKCILFRTERGQNFIGPDNGVFSMVAEIYGVEEIREVTNEDLMRSDVTYTFPGRDIMAPVAGHISKGVEISKAGARLDEMYRLDFEKPIVENDQIRGMILNIDDFGNLVTNINREMLKDLAQIGSELRIKIGDCEFLAPYVETFKEVSPGEKLCYVGDLNMVEIAKNSGNLNDEVDAKIDSQLVIKST